MQCDYLLEFLVTVDSGSMAKAATKIGLSQSSLSRHIKTLETELGMQLVRRNSQGVEITADGMEVYKRSSALLDIVKDVEDYAVSRASTKTLAVYGLSDYPGLTRQLCDAYAKLGLGGSVRTVPHDQLSAASPVEALESGEVTLWITYSSDELLPEDGEQGLISVELFHPRMMAIMETKNPLAERESLVAADLDRQEFNKTESSFMRASTSWSATKALFDARGIRYRTRTGTFEHESDWFVDFDHRILTMPEGNRSIELLRSFGKLVLPVEDLSYTFVAVYCKGNRPVERLIEECRDAAGEEDGGD